MNPEERNGQEVLAAESSAEQVDQTPKTSEELKHHIDERRKAVQSEENKMAESSEAAMKSAATDPEAASSDVDAAQSELTQLGAEAEAVVDNATSQLDELNKTTSPEAPVQQGARPEEIPEEQTVSELPQDENGCVSVHAWVKERKDSGQIDEVVLDFLEDVINTKRLNNEEFGYRNKPENLNETVELAKQLPEIFKQFNGEIQKLANTEGFSDNLLKEKNDEIKKAFVESVFNGNLTAAEVSTMIKNVEIISKTGNDPDRQEQIDQMTQQFGYESTMHYDIENQRLVIFADTLKDQFEVVQNGQKMGINLNFRHMINHEIGHGVAERLLVNNRELDIKCADIIKWAKETQDFPDTQSMHIKNVLRTLADEDPQLAAHEILGDYTALFLKSDGTFEGFVGQCLDMTDKEKAKSAFGNISSSEINAVLSIEDQDQRRQDLEKLKADYPTFGKAMDVYETFYKEITQSMKSEDRKALLEPVEETEEEEEEEEGLENALELLSGGYTGGFSEAPMNSAPPQPKEQKAKGESFWASFGGLMKAFGDDLLGK